MVAIGASAASDVDLGKLYCGVKDKLPTYARPYFIRIISETDITGML